MRYRTLCAALACALLAAAPNTQAQAPDSISFQGFLTDTGGNPVDSTGVLMTFTLYRNSSAVWSEQQSVDVDNGQYGVYLGSVVPLDTLKFDAPFELGIKLDTEPSEMTPRTPLAAVPYARALPGLYTAYKEDADEMSYNVIGGAANNVVGSNVIGATIGGGGGIAVSAAPNRVSANFTTIGGGNDNSAGAYGATVGGGTGNTAEGIGATIPGGEGNAARAQDSFAAGYKARARHAGSFVWSDRSKVGQLNDSLASTNTNQFIARATNGFGINTAPANQGLHLRQGGLTKQYGIRTEGSNSHYWETYIDVFDDYNFAFNGSNTSWVEDVDGLFYSVYSDALDIPQPYGNILSEVRQLKPSVGRAGRGPSTDRSPTIPTTELEQLFPELVRAKDGAKGVNYAGLSVIAIKAIQELSERVEQQQAEIERLRRIVEARN